MEKPLKVKAVSYRGMNISWNLNLLSGPKFIIRCGYCDNTFEKRLPLINKPTVVCPNCNVVNELDLYYE